MSFQAYSDLKAAWHLDRIRDLRSGNQVVPSQVQLIISDLCNHDCHFCSYRMSGGFSTEQFAEDGNRNPNRKIALAKALEILDDCRTLGVRAIQFTGGGEPTVHPDHLEIFRAAQDNGLETSLVTNGNILRIGWSEIFARMAWIRVSWDAWDEHSYARIRSVKPEFFKKAVDNTARIAQTLRDSGSSCLLGVGYVVTRENYEGLVDGVKLARDTGASYVRLSAMFSDLGAEYYDGIYDTIKASIRAAKVLETDTFKVVDLFGDRISDLRQHAPDYEFCGYQQFNMYIGGNLKVYRCCTTSYTKHGEVGDLLHQRLSTWFYSEQKRSAYGGFDARSCHTCQFNNKNRVIGYMIQNKPTHVEFV